MKFVTITFLVILVALCAVLYFLPGYINAPHARPVITETIDAGRDVAATTYPIWVLTREVANGTGLNVTLLTPADAGCPHDYALTTNDLLKIGKKPLLLFANGAGLDDHICKAAMTANKGILVVDTSAGLEIVGDDDDHDHHEHADGGDDDHDEHAEHHHDDGDDDEHDEHEAEEHHHEAEGHHHHHHHGGENGHFFASPNEARKIVAAIADALANNDLVHADAFHANAEKLDHELETLAGEFKTQLEPFASKHVAAQHNIFDYLLSDCGFELPIPIYAEPETPPSPAEITKLAKEFKEHDVKVIFTEPQYPDELAALLAKETGSKAVKLDPVASGPLDPPAGYYVETMKRNLEIMKKALAE